MADQNPLEQLVPRGSRRRNALEAVADFMQSASNGVASTLSGPVDLIGAGMRYAGVPVPENAVGSSRWMAEKGLTRDVPMGASRVVGEALGMASPTVIAAKAAPIASGLIKMAENSAARPTLSKQAGALLFAPHKPDPKKLAQVVAEMEQLGPPTIKAAWDGEKYLALEGAHRIAAAKKLGLTPVIDEVAERSWLTNHDLQDLPDKTSVMRALRYLYDRPDAVYNFPDL